MRIEVWERGFKASTGLRNYAGLRLMSVLDHLVRQVEGVTVCVADVGVPVLGIAKRCRMIARLTPSGEVRVEHGGPALYAAIDGAAERLAAGVSRELRRRDVTEGISLGQHHSDAIEPADLRLVTATGLNVSPVD